MFLYIVIKNFLIRHSLKPDFLAYRGTFAQLLRTPYEKWNGWKICVAKFKGNYYLCGFDLELKEEKSESLRRALYWGRKFENFMLSGNFNF